MDLVAIPAGTFWRGCPNSERGARPHWKPSHQVTISSVFSMSRFPVTQALYVQIMGENPSAAQGEDLPVTNVSFFDAVRFCNELSLREGRDQAYRLEANRVAWNPNSKGFRLPTESEWELAARGPEGRRFPWGDRLATKNVCWNGPGNRLGQGNRRGPDEVWRYPEGASPGGVMALAGHVWEWTFDRIGPYPSADVHLIDPTGPAMSSPAHHPLVDSGKSYRVLRGGAWNIHEAKWLLGAARCPEEEHQRHPDIGIRVVHGALGSAGDGERLTKR